MKRFFVSLAIIAGIAFGCSTANPKAGQPGEPDFIPSPKIEAAHQTVKAVADSVAPVNPYAGIVEKAIDCGFGLATIISLALAKSRSAHKAAADSLAETVTRANLQTQALQIAASNGVAQVVHEHLDNNTPGIVTQVSSFVPGSPPKT